MSVLDRIPALYYPTMLQDVIDTLRANGGYVPDIVAGDNKGLTPLLGIYQPQAGINWASLRKPVVNSKSETLTNAEMATSGAEIDSILGTYTTKRYGLNVAGRNSGITLYNLFLTVQALGDGIVYYLPTGGEDKEPYRLSDFNGYYPASPQPLFGALQGEVVINSVFDGLALDYSVSTGAKEGALTFDDLYEPTDENGNDIEWRTGVILKDGLDFTYIIDSINSTFLMENQEKTFEAVQFITSFPKGTPRPNGVYNEEWKNHRIFGIPNGIFTLTINKFPEGGGGGSGNTGVSSAFRISVGSEYPKFNGFGSGTTDIYRTVLIRFTVSFNSGVGNINSLSVRLYADKNHTNEIDYEQLGSFTDFLGSKDFNVTLDNTNLTTNAWVGIWLDGNLQFFKQVAMPRQERPTAI